MHRGLSATAEALKRQTMTRDLWKARFSNYSNQLDDTDKIRRLRREIARVKTIMTERANKAAGENG